MLFIDPTENEPYKALCVDGNLECLEVVMPEEKTFEERVKQVLEEVRPFLQRDGGDCELVGFEGRKVKIRLQGACSGCPGAQMTLKMGIERHLKERVPEVEQVIPA